MQVLPKTQTITLNLDSKDGVFSTNSDFTGKYTGGTYPTISSFSIPRPLQQVSSIKLKSAEIPITADNVRPSNYSHHVGFQMFNSDGTTYASGKFIATAGNYTSVVSLLTNLNASVSGLLINGFTPTLSYEFVDNAYKVRMTWGGATGGYTFKVLAWETSGFAYNGAGILLGFTGKESMSGTAITATFSPTLNPDLYYNVSIYNNQMNLPSINTNTNLQATFKLPSFVSKGTIMYWNELTGFVQRRFLDNTATINNLTVRITDRWGYDLPCLADFSITLEIECGTY